MLGNNQKSLEGWKGNSKDDDKGKPEVILVNEMKVTWNPERNQTSVESSFAEALSTFSVAI